MSIAASNTDISIQRIFVEPYCVLSTILGSWDTLVNKKTVLVELKS